MALRARRAAGGRDALVAALAPFLQQAGLPPQLEAVCDVAVKIPMRGRADSLNLSVATGIMIYAVTE